MKETIKETLARAEFWSMEAMNYYSAGDKRHDMLSRAYALIREAASIEEETARKHVLMAAQIHEA